MAKDFIEKRVWTMSRPWIVLSPDAPSDAEIYAILEGYRNQGGDMLLFDRATVAEYPIPFGYHKSEIGRGWEWSGAGFLIVPDPETGLWFLEVWGFEDYWITIYWWFALPIPISKATQGVLFRSHGGHDLISGKTGASAAGIHRRGKNVL